MAPLPQRVLPKTGFSLEAFDCHPHFNLRGRLRGSQAASGHTGGGLIFDLIASLGEYGYDYL
jgi:hypothetical protein